MTDREHKPFRFLPASINKGSMRLKRVDGETYLERRRFSTPWFRVLLHKMEVPDPGTHLHDHPWPFKSLILWGGYTEETEDTRYAAERAFQKEFNDGTGPTQTYGDRKTYRMFQVNRMPLNKAHRIVELNKRTCWTLCLAGRRVRDWGFYESSQKGGWIRHDLYDSKAHRGDLKTEGTFGVDED